MEQVHSPTMQFTLPAMSCGHCVRAITEAVHAVDAKASVEIDLPNKQLKVHTALAREAVAQQLAEAGYPPG
jgi:copper chaperone